MFPFLSSLKIWSLVKDDERFMINHSETITCYVITADHTHLITGSKDQSLKVWMLKGGKLTQVISSIPFNSKFVFFFRFWLVIRMK